MDSAYSWSIRVISCYRENLALFHCQFVDLQDFWYPYNKQRWVYDKQWSLRGDAKDYSRINSSHSTVFVTAFVHIPGNVSFGTQGCQGYETKRNEGLWARKEKLAG